MIVVKIFVRNIMAPVIKYLPKNCFIWCSLCMCVLFSSSVLAQRVCNPGAASDNCGIGTDGYNGSDALGLFRDTRGRELVQSDVPKASTLSMALAGVGGPVNEESGASEGFSFDPLTGQVSPGGVAEVPLGRRGGQKPFAQTGTMSFNSEISNFLADELFVEERMSKFLSTKVGLASAAITFSAPAAAPVYMQAVTVGYQHLEAAGASHNAYMAAIAQHPNGAMLKDVYLGCIERKTREEGGGAVTASNPKMAWYNAVAACQGDTYANKSLVATNTSNNSEAPSFDPNYWNNMRAQFARRIDTSLRPQHDPCHPLHPFQESKSSEWSKAQVTEATKSLVENRILLTDKLFCEYHLDEANIPAAPGVGVTDEQKKARRVGLLTESYFKKVIGNAALIWSTNGDTYYEGATEMEWQKVAPRTMPWPPDATDPSDQFPAPEVLPLYRAGEIFVALTQFMRNRCEVSNQLDDINFGASSPLTRGMPGGSLAGTTLEIYNGTSSVTLSAADTADIVKTGYCSTQAPLVDQQRAFVSLPKLPFNGKTCDAFWYRTKDHFLQEAPYPCNTLQGCIDPGLTGATCGSTKCKDGSSCELAYSTIRENVTNYPLWVQMLYAYSTAGGYIAFRAELQQLYAHIESMTGSRYTWMLDMARELIESRIDTDVEDENAVLVAALKEEIDKAIKEEVENPGGGAIVSSGPQKDLAGGLGQ